MMYFVDVAVDKPLYQLFTYRSSYPIAVGNRVLVPFGKNKTVVAIVVRINHHPQLPDDKIKNIKQVLDEMPLFNQEWISLIEFTANYYLYPIGQSFFHALPAQLKKTEPITFPAPRFSYRLKKNTDITSRSPSVLKLIKALSGDDFITLETACTIHPQAKKYLKHYLKEGLLEQQKAVASWHYYRPALHAEQEKASMQIIQALGQFQVFTLFGVTGSGKTEVYFEAIHKVLCQGKQILLLLPLINLTPQFLARLLSAFPGITLSILHSHISQGKRLDAYIKAASGHSQIIIGTRLAVFTPLKDLALIIVDEEHEESFKQENELRYQARDLAIWRAKKNNCPIVLGSATPSLSTWWQTKRFHYQLLELKKRARLNAVLPEVKLLSLRNETLQEGFSTAVLKRLEQQLHEKKLTLIYLNRRGFSPCVICFDCANVVTCPHCSAKMVYHRKENLLKCHHCAAMITPPRICPSCGSQELTALGIGTERIEQFLTERFPSARIARVDSDSMSHKNAWTNLYQRITANSIDLLIGTQMLAKGHDFAALNLVVVLQADYCLYSADYRASERLFNELMQVAGRAGRSCNTGEVIIQTNLAHLPFFSHLMAHDYVGFAKAQLKERQDLGFPPYMHRIILHASHYQAARAKAFLEKVAQLVCPRYHVKILGPVPMLLEKQAGRFRFVLYFESADRQAVHEAAKEALRKLLVFAPNDPLLRWTIDVDPYES